MGSCPFTTMGRGNSPQAAYEDALDDARCENGHRDGYSGDIQTTTGFTLIEKPKGLSVAQTVDSLIDEFPKWGPCACLLLKPGEYLFFGWAAE